MEKNGTFFSAEEMNSAAEYWHRQLIFDVCELDLQYDFPKTLDAAKEMIEIDFAKDLVLRLSEICKGQHLLLYILLVAVVKILLFKYVQQKSIIISAPLYSTSGEYYDFNKCLPLVDLVDEEMTFKELLGQIQKTIVEGYKNQHYSIDEVLESINSGNRKINYMKVLVLLENIHIKASVDDIIDSSNNDIAIVFMKLENKIEMKLIYDSSGFERNTIDGMAELFLHILRQVISNGNIDLRRIELTKEAQKKMMLFDFNDTEINYPPDSTVLNEFESQVSKSPHHIGLFYKDIGLTYKELDEQAGRLAAVLAKVAVSVNHIVGIMAKYSPEMIIGMVGILKAGGAYLPIDPGYPVKRIEYMLSDAAVDVLLSYPPMLSRINFAGKSISLEERELFRRESIAPIKTVSADSMAYIIYTSGSTGTPKGVIVEHKNLLNYTLWRIKICAFTLMDKTLQLISPSFDGFGANLYPTILSGGTLILPDPSRFGDFKFINRLIEKIHVTHMSVVPVMYRACLECLEDDELRSLRIVVLAGEKAPIQLIQLSQQKNRDVVLMNEYGPTENTIAVSAFVGITVDAVGIIGRPVDNTRVYILDRCNQLQPVGVAGELCVAGQSLTRGYCNRSEMTGEKFVAHPLIPDEIIYKTGDRARWLKDGNIELLGRIDQQVKVRGYRVEPEEIESAILKTGSVDRVVVVNKNDLYGNNFLCAYFTSDHAIEIRNLKEELSTLLPDYMVPSKFIQLEALPLTHNGKLDRHSLPDPDQSVAPAGGYVAPVSELQKKLASLWQEVLQVERVGINDNFFDLGGNSILLMKVNSQIEKFYPGCLNIADFFAYPSITRLSEFIESKQEKRNLNVELKTLKLPTEYFVDSVETCLPTDFKFQISGVLFDKMVMLSSKVDVPLRHITLCPYVYLLARAGGVEKITIQTVCHHQNRVIPLDLDLGKVRSLTQFLKQLVHMQKENEYRGYFPMAIDKIKRKQIPREIVPLFGHRDLLETSDSWFEIFDIIMEISEERDRLSFICQFTGQFREDKVVELIREYINICHFVVMRCLGDTGETGTEGCKTIENIK